MRFTDEQKQFADAIATSARASAGRASSGSR